MKYKYYLNGTEIKKVQEEKDLGIIISEDLKPMKHIAKTVKKANQLLGMIRRTITCKNKTNILNLYKTLVRPILDYGSAIWSPHQKKDIQKIERVQRRATKMIKEIRNMTYTQRLKKCGLMTLEERRRRYDLLEMFKIMKGIYKMDKELFETKENITRGHEMKIWKKQCRLNMRKQYFTQRIINDWNKLPTEAINAKTIVQFKSIIDPEFKHGGLYMIQ